LGESHTSPDHHFWQMQTVAGLGARTDHMAIGFESFPRRLQPVLDDWSAGKLTADQFLKATASRTAWGPYPPLHTPPSHLPPSLGAPQIAPRSGAGGWGALAGGGRAPTRARAPPIRHRPVPVICANWPPYRS